MAPFLKFLSSLGELCGEWKQSMCQVLQGVDACSRGLLEVHILWPNDKSRCFLPTNSGLMLILVGLFLADIFVGLVTVYSLHLRRRRSCGRLRSRQDACAGDVDAEIDVDVFWLILMLMMMLTSMLLSSQVKTWYLSNLGWSCFGENDIQIILLLHREQYQFHDFLNFAWKSDFPNVQNETNQMIS